MTSCFAGGHFASLNFSVEKPTIGKDNVENGMADFIKTRQQKERDKKREQRRAADKLFKKVVREVEEEGKPGPTKPKGKAAT
jgi:hypothetical protein